MKDHSTEYLQWLRTVRRASHGTVQTYGRTLYALRAYGSDSTLEGLEGFVTRQRRGKEPAPATMAREVTCLRSYYSWMHKRGLIPADPTSDLVAPAVHNIQPKPIDDATWLDVWQRPLTDRERLALGLPFFAGLRRAEVAALLPTHVQLGPLVIHGFTRKGGGDDVLHLGDVLEVFHQRLPHLRADLFEASLRSGVPRAHPDMPLIRGQLNNIYRSMGVEFSPHCGRHSFVTNLLRAGLPLHIVTRLANHASPSTTMRYCRVAGTDVAEWLVTSER